MGLSPIKHLDGMRFENDIIDNLGKLPKTLKKSYSQVLDSMRGGTPCEWEITHRALMWIMYAQRLLTKEEWIELSYFPKGVPQGGEDDLFELCQNLVKWDSESRVMRFAHLSVREYLETEFDPLDAHSMAAEWCFSLLATNHSETGIEPLDYASKSWAFHVGGSYGPSRQMSCVLLNKVKYFFGTPAAPSQGYRNWIRRESRRRRPAWSKSIIDDVDSTPLNPLFAASYFSFGGELGDYWELDGTDINCKNARGQTMLHVGSKRGNEGAVKNLLKKGADINDERLLKEAMRNGHGGWRFSYFVPVHAFRKVSPLS